MYHKNTGFVVILVPTTFAGFSGHLKVKINNILYTRLSIWLVEIKLKQSLRLKNLNINNVFIVF